MATKNDDAVKPALLVISPWSRRWELDPRGGVADDYHFIRAFASTGRRVHYLCPREDAPADITLDGYVRHDFPNFYEPTRGWPTAVRRVIWPVLFSFLTVVYGVGLARRLRPEVILGQTHLSSFAVWLLGWVMRVPTAVKLFGVEDLARTDLPRLAYLRRNLEIIVAMRFPHAAWIILDDGTDGRRAAIRNGVVPETIEYLPNGINMEWADGHHDGEWLRRTLDLPAAAGVVIYVSRLVDWKQPDAAIRAIALVARKTSRPVVLVIAGDGPQRRPCEVLAQSLGVSDRVRFAGAIEHERIPDAMSGSLLLVATNARSNMSIPVCEAMVCGVPVVAFDTGETRRVVKDGVNGRLVLQGNIDALADAIVELMEDEEKRLEMSRGARAFARESFVGWEERMRVEVGIISGLALRGRGGRGRHQSEHRTS